ncbi:CD209 antigen-like [Brienomyrus brachyistius]|uniref:CD209 antigen-like n=1 Tax=Brienomyrus brachyistius TaxID=42636 RepID=UPI0020B3739D|nr:CD209 antigen-like [Brienomyrus brachyistius]
MMLPTGYSVSWDIVFSPADDCHSAVCLHEKLELQTSYSTCTAEKEQLQMNYSTYTENCRKKQIQLCPEGWTRFGTQLYCISTEKRTWQESQQDCKNRGADLIIINSQQEQVGEEIIPLKNIILHTDAWIGLTDSDHEGTWKWVDGTPLTTSFWRDGEPNNVCEEDCAHNNAGRNPKKSWNDKGCSAKSFWVCEKEA